MNDRPLLVFDFDGVIVDGMAEYWWSAWHACRRLEAAPEGLTPDQVPDAFRQLRPWVHHGWEMVLLAAELPVLNLQVWLESYGEAQASALQRRGWRPEQLQAALDDARDQAVRQSRSAWLALHRPFPGLVERLQQLEAEGVDWSVLTRVRKVALFSGELGLSSPAGSERSSLRDCPAPSRSFSGPPGAMALIRYGTLVLPETIRRFCGIGSLVP